MTGARRCGLSVPEIFAREGAPGFRARELDALRALAADAPLVVASGGGVVETPAATALLRERGLVVWLDAPWEVLRRRLEAADAPQRPLVRHLGWDGLERLAARRRPLYAACAHFRLRSDRLSPAGLARATLARQVAWTQRREAAGG